MHPVAAVNTRKSSIHFDAVKRLGHALTHAARTSKRPPSYVLKGAAAAAGVRLMPNNLPDDVIQQRFKMRERLMTPQARAKSGSPFWEGVFNLHTFAPPMPNGAPDPKYVEEYVQFVAPKLAKFAHELEQQFGLYAMHISIHLDEGSVKDNGSIEFNPHAHILVDRFGRNVATTKMPRFNRALMRQIQTLCADTLEMERGKPGGRRLGHTEYRLKKRTEELKQAKQQLAETERRLRDAERKLWDFQEKILDLQHSTLTAQQERDTAVLERDAAKQDLADLQLKNDSLTAQIAELQKPKPEPQPTPQTPNVRQLRRQIRTRMAAVGIYRQPDYLALAQISDVSVLQELSKSLNCALVDLEGGVDLQSIYEALPELDAARGKGRADDWADHRDSMNLSVLQTVREHANPPVPKPAPEFDSPVLGNNRPPAPKMGW